MLSCAETGNGHIAPCGFYCVNVSFLIDIQFFWAFYTCSGKNMTCALNFCITYIGIIIIKCKFIAVIIFVMNKCTIKITLLYGNWYVKNKILLKSEHKTNI